MSKATFAHWCKKAQYGRMISAIEENPPLPTALIVDDSLDIRYLLKQALEFRGYAVHEAANGKIAQEWLMGGARPSVILLDLMMPIMDGHQFLSWKTNASEFADIPTVVLSASKLPPSIEGAAACLMKPVQLKDMFALIEGFGD